MLASDLPPVGAASSASRAVGAAEKYAELESDGLSRRTCECHGTPMRWKKSNRTPVGGWWECETKQAAHRAAYMDAHRAEKRVSDRKSYWNHTGHQRAKILMGQRRRKAVARGRDESKIDPRFANHISKSIDIAAILEGVMG